MFTHRGANLALDLITGRSYTNISAYLGMSSTKPTRAGGNFTEPSASEYARVLVGTYNGNVKLFSAASEGKTANNDNIYFPVAKENYSRLLYVGIFSSSTGAAASALVWFAPILYAEYVRSSAEIANAVTLSYDKENDIHTFLSAVSETGGDYEFTYDGSSWKLSGSAISLSTYGITISSDVTPASGDTITVHFGIVPTNKTVPMVEVGKISIEMY